MLKRGENGTVMAPATVGTCNKCGKQRELVFAGRVCSSCSDLLDKHWAGVTVTDWILIRPGLSIFQALKRSLAKKSGDIDESTIPLKVPSRYIYRSTTYAQIKLHWAKFDSYTDLDSDPNWLGPAASPEVSEMEPPVRSSRTLIRPATPEEIAHHDDKLRMRRRWDVINKVGAKWGLDDEGEPFDSRWDTATKRRAQQGEFLQVRRELGELGLLKGTPWDIDLPNSVDGETAIRESKDSTRGLAKVAGMATLSSRQ